MRWFLAGINDLLKQDLFGPTQRWFKKSLYYSGLKNILKMKFIFPDPSDIELPLGSSGLHVNKWWYHSRQHGSLGPKFGPEMGSSKYWWLWGRSKPGKLIYHNCDLVKNFGCKVWALNYFLWNTTYIFNFI